MPKTTAERRAMTQAIDNLRQGRTLSGLDINGAKSLAQVDTYLDGYADVFWNYFFDAHGLEGLEPALAMSLEAVQDAKCVGDFIREPRDQIAALAAFGLVQIDRFVQHATAGGSGWDSFYLYDQVTECHEYVHHCKLAAVMPDAEKIAKVIISKANSRAAYKRHQRDPKQAAKAFVFECWESWTQSPAQYKNMTLFARSMLDKYPDTLESEVVITRWVRQWRKRCD